MPRAGGLESLSIGEVQKLLKWKLGRLNELKEERRRLRQELRRIDKELKRLARGGGRLGLGAGAGRARIRGEKSLREFIVEALQKSRKGLRPSEILEAITQAGYRTASDKPYTLVNQALVMLKKQGVVEHDRETRTYRLAKETARDGRES
ncbi:MAG: hypothetical protein C4297_12830 [Gemmataceae bacterium]